MMMPSIFGENLFDDFFTPFYYDDKDEKKAEKKLYGHRAQNLLRTDIKETKEGYELELTSKIAENVSIPVIASGGAGTKEHFYDALTEGKADAALAASLFHYKELEICDLKDYLAERGVSVRR